VISVHDCRNGHLAVDISCSLQENIYIPFQTQPPPAWPQWLGHPTDSQNKHLELIAQLIAGDEGV